MKFTLLSSLVLSSLALFSGCGSEVQDLSLNHAPIMGAPDSGVFVNSVEGLEYTRTLSPIPKTTDNAASYSYRAGELINFHVGNLQIGEVVGLSIITPKDIVAYKNLELNTSIHSSEVNNRVRLLMALDDDGIYSNGIQISQTKRDQAQGWSTPDYAMNEADFTSAVSSATAGQLTLNVSKDEAETHFTEALRCVYSGAYRGSWIMPSGAKEGFVGVMIQSTGSIVALGDGQDVNNDGNYSDVIYSSGDHDMDTGSYDFNATYHFDVDLGKIVSSNLTNIDGTGSSQGYNRVSGVFVQDGQNGAYTASRVGQGTDTSYRYTGFGYLNNDGDANNPNDPILGLFTFDISQDGNITGLIHDARTNEEPSLTGSVNFTTGDLDLSLNSGLGHTLSGNINFDTNSSVLSLEWYDNTHTKLGYIQGVGCQLQPHK